MWIPTINHFHSYCKYFLPSHSPFENVIAHLCSRAFPGLPASTGAGALTVRKASRCPHDEPQSPTHSATAALLALLSLHHTARFHQRPRCRLLFLQHDKCPQGQRPCSFRTLLNVQLSEMGLYSIRDPPNIP